MYNEEQKDAFIRSYTSSNSTTESCIAAFNAIEKYESKWSADICTKSGGELEEVVEMFVGMRDRSKWAKISMLRSYASWCIATGVHGACDGLLHISASGISKIKKYMVSSPMHLQKCLDEVFADESLNTVDNIFRCYFWMAFAGMKEEDVFNVREEDVHLNNLNIIHDGKTYPLYREAIGAFSGVIGHSEFLYMHPNYTGEKSGGVMRERVPGNTIMRGVKSEYTVLYTRATISKKITESIRCGNTQVNISFYRSWMSGVFYRMYENERAGGIVNFSEAAVSFMDGKAYKTDEKHKLLYRQNQIVSEYKEDYERWKLAFSV